MNIQSSVRPVNTTSLERPKDAKVTRPPHERWFVGDDVFNSTSEMLGSGISLDGKTAVYNYAFFAKGEDNAISEKKRAGRKGALIAGGIGSGITALVGGALVSNSLGGYDPWTQTIAIIAGMTGATIGLSLFSYKLGYHQSPDVTITEKQGVIRQKGDQLDFHLNGELENAANLQVHSQAVVPELNGWGRRDYGDQWWNTPSN